MRPPRQRRSRETRERILRTAERLLNESPFAELTMPGLAIEAGISVGGLYAHFPSREALLDVVQSRYRERRDRHLRTALAVERTPLSMRERVAAVARAFVDLHTREAGVLRSFLIRTWLQTPGGPPQDVLEEISDHRRACEAFLLDGERADPGLAERVSRAVGYVVSISKDQLVIAPDTDVEAESIDRDQLVADIVAMATTVIGASSGPAR